MTIPNQTLKYSPPIPLLGLGTYLLTGEECHRVVRSALELGYRHFDTALLYENHQDIAQAIKGFDRDQLFLTSKVMPYHLDRWSVTKSCEITLKELQTHHLDLFLMHYPDRSRPMEQLMVELASLIEKGLTKAIGVSNFTTRHLEDLAHLNLPIAVNQVEFHPYLNQTELHRYCQSKGIQIVSYRSLGKGGLTHDPLFETIGKRYHKTASQISLRWLVQQGIPVIPKTSSTKHLQENCEIFDFSLTEEDFKILSELPPKPRFCEKGDWADFNYV